MSIETILTLADGSDDGTGPLASAVAIARRFSAHLDVLHVTMDPIDMIPVVSEEASGAMVAKLMETISASVTKRRDAARSAYDRVCALSGLSVTWREVVGREPAVLQVVGRLADLLVIPRPERASNDPLTETLDAALFDCGRPVLVLPRGALPPTCHRVIIAWNGSAQAARAVTASIPFLHMASQIEVVTVGDIDQQASANALVPYLARHDVKATVHVLEPDNRSIGDALLEAAHRLEADLLVMGAYGHSRLREWVLGGATREVLTSSTLPVLMTH